MNGTSAVAYAIECKSPDKFQPSVRFVSSNSRLVFTYILHINLCDDIFDITRLHG